MSHKIRYRLLSLNARLLQNMLAVIGLAGFLTACSGGNNNEKEVNQDSLNKVKEQQRLDSIAKVQEDSLAQVRTDSLLKVREDSIAKAKAQQKPVPGPAITKYGVPDDFNEPQATKYGVRPDFRNQQ